MNENLNLFEILKDCPRGTKLYSTVYGEVELANVFTNNVTYPIEIKTVNNSNVNLTKEGGLYANYGECLLFPSKEQRDWSKFKVKKPKFDTKTLKPFDKVLIRDKIIDKWKCSLFSHIVNGDYGCKYSCIGSLYAMCIPYNDDTKHLVGTTDEPPEFYI